MECTQRLECTQELYAGQCDRRSPEQIGFLGICGKKYPVKRGPNKIGRDPSTCSIVLNLNSISRQHAVLNVINGKDFLLMDLDSANKTKHMGKALPAYMPQPLKNGDTVQFGDVFGIFRLLEEDDDLPLTQAIDMPETPVLNKHTSRINAAAIVVPESPDVSDRDDSFIMPTQPKSDQKFKSPSSKFIKQSSKTISIQPIGSNKIDNVFWNSSKKSTSINLDDSKSSLNDSSISVRSENGPTNQIEDIHEMETQPPPKLTNGQNENIDPIYEAETQMPPGVSVTDTIYNQDTQYPITNKYLPQVRTIDDQHNMHLDISIENKENENIFNAETQLFVKNQTKVDPSIFEAETQLPTINHQTEEKDISIFEINTQLPTNLNFIKPEAKDTTKDSSSLLNKSKEENTSTDDDLILFDEIDSQSFEEEFSQRILSEDLPIHNIDDHKRNEDIDSEKESSKKSKEVNDSTKLEDTSKTTKRTNRLNSDSSTDCEDVEILQSQKDPFKPAEEDDLTDCEDDMFGDKPKTAKPQPVKKTNTMLSESPEIDFEDMPTQILGDDLTNTTNKTVAFKSSISNNDVDFEDMPTQVILDENPEEKMDFEDLPTQVLPEEDPVKPSIVKTKAEQFLEVIASPFKVPLQTTLKNKRKDILKTKRSSNESIQKVKTEENYYEATQEVLNDLCTQQECSPEVVITPRKNLSSFNNINRSPSSSKKESSKTVYVQVKLESSDNEDKVNEFTANLTSSQVREVIGVDEKISAPKKMPSDPSDGEGTPKKVRPFKLMATDLPNSQEIKTSVSFLNSKPLTTDSSSESEVEEDSQENTPILFKKKKNPKNNAKIDLTKKFDTALPARVITRIRKPTSKLLDCDKECKKLTKRMLKPTVLADQEIEIDTEIIQENITRLKTENEKRSLDKSAIFKLDGKKHVSSPDKQNIVKEENYDSKNETKKDESSKNYENRSKNKKGELKESRHDEKFKESKQDEKMERKKQRNEDNSKTKKKTDPKDKKSKERQKDVKSKSKETHEENEEKTRPRRTRNKTDTKTLADKNYSVTDNSSLSKTIDTILATSNSSLKNSSTILKSSSGRKRSFRYRGKSDNKEEKSPEEVPKRKRGRPKLAEVKVDKDDSSPEPEIRRSRRHRVIKDNDRDSNKQLSQLKRGSHEQSTVYSVSSESGVDSPRRKRTVVEDVRPPSPKRTRSVANLPSNGAPSARARSNHAQTQQVLFTAFPCEEVKTKLENLGAIIVNDVRSSSVVVTVQIRRTFKLLCAVGLGKPVVGPQWVQACVDTGILLDPWNYLLEDTATERRFCFSLAATLRGRRGFLQGCTLSATPAVLPPAYEMQQIVECSGGTWCGDPARMPRCAGARVVVSCAADRALWPALARRSVNVVSTEFILTGVLRQEFDVDKYRLYQ